VLTATSWKLEEIWERVKDLDPIFGDDSSRDKSTYLGQFLSPDTVVLEMEGGIVLLSKILEGVRCEVHPVFWDHKISARRELLQELMLWTFLTFDLNRIETFVGDYARGLMRVIGKVLGFSYEGTMRKRIVHNGIPMDVHVYSILREEVL
jgi:hypothetical protein